jgi:hypothetical protein
MRIFLLDKEGTKFWMNSCTIFARISVSLARSSPEFQPESIPRISATTSTRRIREQGQEAFHRMIEEISG